MNASWLEELLPSAIVTSRTRIWWFAFFALFPLAYTGGVKLHMGQESFARIAGSEDRTACLQTAERFAASKGFAVANWHEYVIEETRDNLVAYYGSRKGADIDAARALAPDREVQVLFRSPDQSHEFRTYLSLTGQVTGYDYGESTERSRNVTSGFGIVSVQTTTTSEPKDLITGSGNAQTASEQNVEKIARRFWARNEKLSSMVELGRPTITTNQKDKSRSEVAWDVSPARLKGLKLHIVTSVLGSEVVAQHIQGSIDQRNERRTSASRTLLESLYGFFLTLSAFFAMYRYARRTLQKEVSHLRTLVVAALFFVSYGILAYSLGIDQLATRVSGATFLKMGIFTYALGGLTFAIMGLLVGIGYGSGEGELREAYPGKLTSLDALLAGRIFSRDVAASFLFGAAAAGWLLLGQHALGHFLQEDVAATRSDALSSTFARLPWLTLLVGSQYHSLLIAVAGLLLPASFLVSRSMRWRKRFMWLILFALLSVLGDAAKYPTIGLALVAMIVLASALLLPFFAFDLLSAMVSLSALTFVNQLVTLTVVVRSWTPFALSLAALTAGALALAAYLALHGTRVREEDVRPVYARNLAERLAMQAEILAAREAQLRLLPQATPELPGIQLAACCLPARGVGGDFYDFFWLDTNRVGIFIAQGSEQGLASALCIALAKGLLMHASQQSLSPKQIILGLEASIAELLEYGSGTGISFAYGVMDTRRNLLSYARTGTSPRLMIYREGVTLAASSQLEREVSEAGRSRDAGLLYEGVAEARPGDFLVFMTKGVMSLRAGRLGKRDSHWFQGLLHELVQQEEPLQTSLATALAKHQNDASEDLTAVVLRIMKSQAGLQEVVA